MLISERSIINNCYSCRRPQEEVDADIGEEHPALLQQDLRADQRAGGGAQAADPDRHLGSARVLHGNLAVLHGERQRAPAGLPTPRYNRTPLNLQRYQSFLIPNIADIHTLRETSRHLAGRHPLLDSPSSQHETKSSHVQAQQRRAHPDAHRVGPAADPVRGGVASGQLRRQAQRDEEQRKFSFFFCLYGGTD